ncbi:NLRC3 [Symbiodinium sp. CCMP2592]|nr:NLRC3 [Symbiodinium sp. CCMP2592]
MSDGVRHLLVCRVVLGRVYYTDTKDTDPRACEDACLKGPGAQKIRGDAMKGGGVGVWDCLPKQMVQGLGIEGLRVLS